MSKFCTHCGKELFDEAVLCPGCGCSCAPNIQYAAQPTAPAKPREKRTNALMIIGGALMIPSLVMLVLGIVFIVFSVIGYTDLLSRMSDAYALSIALGRDDVFFALLFLAITTVLMIAAMIVINIGLKKQTDRKASRKERAEQKKAFIKKYAYNKLVTVSSRIIMIVCAVLTLSAAVVFAIGSYPDRVGCTFYGCTADPKEGSSYCSEHICHREECTYGKGLNHLTGEIDNYCYRHGCYAEGCTNSKAEDKYYCRSHVCTYKNCSEQRIEGSTYCKKHVY